MNTCNNNTAAGKVYFVDCKPNQQKPKQTFASFAALRFKVIFMVDIESTARQIVHSAIKVHKTLGPGLLESVYQKCLAYELEKAGLKVACETALPVKYENIIIDAGFRIDMLVNDFVIIENKTVVNLLPIHEAQLLTYLKLSNLNLGFLLNWNVTLMKDGIKRMVNNL